STRRRRPRRSEADRGQTSGVWPRPHALFFFSPLPADGEEAAEARTAPQAERRFSPGTPFAMEWWSGYACGGGHDRARTITRPGYRRDGGLRPGRAALHRPPYPYPPPPPA